MARSISQSRRPAGSVRSSSGGTCREPPAARVGQSSQTEASKAGLAISVVRSDLVRSKRPAMPAHEVGQAAVGDDDALRRAGGTRGEDDVGRIQRGSLRRELTVGVGHRRRRRRQAISRRRRRAPPVVTSAAEINELGRADDRHCGPGTRWASWASRDLRVGRICKGDIAGAGGNDAERADHEEPQSVERRAPPGHRGRPRAARGPRRAGPPDRADRRRSAPHRARRPQSRICFWGRRRKDLETSRISAAPAAT